MSRQLIPQAMLWKYGARCSKTADGNYIDKWEHKTQPKPTREQVALDVAEYKEMLRQKEQADISAEQALMTKLNLTEDGLAVLKRLLR